jgi:hypothetical protein
LYMRRTRALCTHLLVAMPMHIQIQIQIPMGIERCRRK